jgi:two-component system, NarL family, sensor histidine kinase DegS
MDANQSQVDTATTLRQTLEQVRMDFEQTQNELQELNVLVQQSATEVEKLAQRNADMVNRVHHIEANLDTMPREDIKEAYTAAQEAQMRLFLMRGQLEQLQSRQQLLTRHRDMLTLVLDAGDRMSTAGMGLAEGHGNGESSSLIARIVNAQETERQRLARQMHDGPAQALTNLILQAQICEKLFDQDPVQAKVELHNLKESVNATFRRVRGFIFDLRPMMLDDLGLNPTIKRYVQDFETKSGLKCTLNLSGKDQRLPPHIEVTVFRVIQGLLTNVQQHANATQVTIHMHIAPNNEMSVSVEDDGTGFDVADVMTQARQRKTMGLITMMEQAEMAGGEIKFDSTPGQGTRVQLHLPL